MANKKAILLMGTLVSIAGLIIAQSGIYNVETRHDSHQVISAGGWVGIIFVVVGLVIIVIGLLAKGQNKQ